MDHSDSELQRHAAADRREVDPPIDVQTATWSKAGQLDSWVKEWQEWLGRVRRWVGYAVQTAANGGSELLISVPRAQENEYL